jgi:hypothetical protein
VSDDAAAIAPDAARRVRAAAACHEGQLRLLERVRAAFGRLDVGEIDVFELDEVEAGVSRHTTTRPAVGQVSSVVQSLDVPRGQER